MTGGLALRPEGADDAAFLAALFRDARPPQERLTGLDPALADRLIALQFAGQTASYRAAFPEARFDIVTVSGEPVGRLVLDEGRASWSLVDLCLREAWRGRGIGTRLVATVTARAGAAGVPVRLRVGTGNVAARRLYERLGFVAEAVDDLGVAMAWAAPSIPRDGLRVAGRDGP